MHMFMNKIRGLNNTLIQIFKQITNIVNYDFLFMHISYSNACALIFYLTVSFHV